MKIRTLSVPSLLRRALVIAGALSVSACADGVSLLDSPATEETPVATQPTPQPTPQPDDRAVVPVSALDPAARAARNDENLAKLASLNLFEVGKLLTDTEGASGSCYGVPCPEEREATELLLATKLDTLVALSHDLTPAPSACSPRTVDAKTASHLGVLDQLNVIEIGAFLKAEPANNPMCYNYPCAEDIAAAEASNCDKAGRLETLAARAALAFDVKAPAVFGVLDAAAEEQVSHDLRVLEQLDVFEVGSLAIHPASCIAYVCPSPDEVLAYAASRLERLAKTATAHIGDYRETAASDFAGCDPEAGNNALQALAALDIVEVGVLIARDAAGEGMCYQGDCSDAQEAAAEAMVCRRADAAQRLAIAAQGLY